MRNTTKIALAVGAALSLGLAAAELTAHPADMGRGNEGQGHGMGYRMHGFGPGHGMGYGAFPGAAAERLQDLKSELGITEQQAPAWQAFVDSVKQREESRQALFAKMRESRSAGSVPEMLAQRDEFFKQQQAERQAGTAALKDLYAALSPEQKTVADRVFGGFGPHYGGPGAGSR